MRRQFLARSFLRVVTMALVAIAAAACGVKGPLQPPPKSAPATNSSAQPKDTPATPPATTSPALPPPIPGAK